MTFKARTCEAAEKLCYTEWFNIHPASSQNYQPPPDQFERSFCIPKRVYLKLTELTIDTINLARSPTKWDIKALTKCFYTTCVILRETSVNKQSWFHKQSITLNGASKKSAHREEQHSQYFHQVCRIEEHIDWFDQQLMQEASVSVKTLIHVHPHGTQPSEEASVLSNFPCVWAHNRKSGCFCYHLKQHGSEQSHQLGTPQHKN